VPGITVHEVCNTKWGTDGRDVKEAMKQAVIGRSCTDLAAPPSSRHHWLVDKDYQASFRFNGRIDKLTFRLGPMQLTEEDQVKLRKAVAAAMD
jgi:hypothetical protein